MIYKKIEIAVDGYKETADLYTYFLDNSIEMHIYRNRPLVVYIYPALFFFLLEKTIPLLLLSRKLGK